MMRVNGSSRSSSCHSTPYSNSQGVPQDGQSPRNNLLLNLSPRPSYQFNPSSADLVKEITTLEGEIINLERYLLSLYRAAFEQHLPSLSENCGIPLQKNIETESPTIADQSCLSREPNLCKGNPDYHNPTSPAHGLTGSDDQNHATTPRLSSKRDRTVADHGHRSLADHLVASRIDNNLNRPDRLSEEIVRCMSSIYCKLADPTLCQTGLSASSNSSLSSSSTFSPRNLSDNWSPHFSEEATGAQIQGLKEESEPYAAMIEVLKLSLDDDSFNYAARMLQNFRLLVKNLEKVEPRKMTREEKLTFWINIHNALVMHAHLAYGISNYVKSTSILKAAYNVGGQCINADIIQSSILGIRSHYAAPWLETLMSPGKKLKGVSTRHVYAIEYPEPLVHFALCSGASSDPAVRVYTVDSVFQDLKLAKEEFIRASVYIHKETKICLPKILDYFAKDMSLTMAGLLEIVNACVSEVQQKAIIRCMNGRPERYINWLTQSSAFRYVINREVVAAAEGRLSVSV